MSNRQAVAVNTAKIGDNKTYFGDRSCHFPVQLNKANVLAKIHAGGFIAERDGNRTKLTNISDLDPKGSIPGFVKNAFATKRAEMMTTIEQKIKNYKK